MDDEHEQKADRQRRVNSWSYPLSPRLIATLTIFAFNALVFVFFLAPLMHGQIRWVLSLVFVLTLITTGVAATWTMTIDPLDPMVAAEESGAVVDLCGDVDVLYCKYCEAHVHPTSKHCWECNKCASNYDHHCEWLNTCIGDRNYRSFFVAICAFLLMVGLVIAVVLVSLAEVLYTHGETPSIFGLHGACLEVLLVCLLLVDVPLWILDLTLVAFHSYLCIAQITTYEYLTGKVTKRTEIARNERDSFDSRGKTLNDNEQTDVPTVNTCQRSWSMDRASPTACEQVGESIRDFNIGTVSTAEPSSPLAIEIFEHEPVASAVSSSICPRTQVVAMDDCRSICSATSAATGVSNFGSLFWPIIAQDNAVDFKRSLSSVIFGSGISTVDEPGRALSRV